MLWSGNRRAVVRGTKKDFPREEEEEEEEEAESQGYASQWSDTHNRGKKKKKKPFLPADRKWKMQVWRGKKGKRTGLRLGRPGMAKGERVKGGCLESNWMVMEGERERERRWSSTCWCLDQKRAAKDPMFHEKERERETVNHLKGDTDQPSSSSEEKKGRFLANSIIVIIYYSL